MAEQQMVGGRGFAPSRIQRTFKRLDDGRGARAAALASSLGVALHAVPQIAKIEGDKAFKEGMESRIDGIKRENSNSTNSSLLGFMFSKRSQDGFDYQDAQLELPVLQSESLLAMEQQLRESRNPDDFRKYVANQDAALQSKFANKSEMYRYTVAEAMQKTRRDQAKLFTSWVQNNRQKDRSAAAAAAAKTKATLRQAQLNEAGNAAFEAAGGGDADWVGEFVKTAPDLYGITSDEAKSLALLEANSAADFKNDPTILNDFPTDKLNPKQRAELAQSIDRITGQQRTYAAIQEEAVEAERSLAAARQESERQLFEKDLAMEVALGQKTVSQAQSMVFDNPLFNDGKTRNDVIARISKVAGNAYDPALETVALSTFDDELTRIAITNGDPNDFNDLVLDTLSQVRDPAKREEIIKKSTNIGKAVKDKVFEGLDSYYTDLKQSFPSGVGSDQSLADNLTGKGATNYFEASVDTQATYMFENHLINMVGEWYDTNEGSIPYSTKRELAQQAYEMAVEDATRTFGTRTDPKGDSGDSTGRLHSIGGNSN